MTRRRLTLALATMALAASGTVVWRADLGHDLLDESSRLVQIARDLVRPDRPAEEPGSDAATPEVSSSRTIVWATEDGELLRAEVPAGAHDEFVAALRESQAKDLDRLSHMAERRLLRDAEPILDETAARVPAFIDAVSSSRVATVNAVFSSLGGSPADPPDIVAEASLRRAGAIYAEQFRQEVLRPAQSVPALRAVAGQVVAAVRTDLIGACDGYDQAFRVFLRANVAKVEALTPDGQWVGQPWTQTNGTFRSLCHTLRATRPDESMFDEAIVRGIGEPTMGVHDGLRDLAAPVAQLASGMMISYNGVLGTLTRWGVPAGIATVPASAWSYGASGPALLDQYFSPALAPTPRALSISTLAHATRDGQAEVVRTLHAALVTYIGGELTAMATGVTARIDRQRKASG